MAFVQPVAGTSHAAHGRYIPIKYPADACIVVSDAWHGNADYSRALRGSVAGTNRPCLSRCLRCPGRGRGTSEGTDSHRPEVAVEPDSWRRRTKPPGKRREWAPPRQAHEGQEEGLRRATAFFSLG